ncbi:MAG: FtsQ-type POTRA domain-containing protein [Clostridia bacterium]|nr:FtsQ-type POTRA domain-containing protein [Clostridia bacterium]
MKGNGRIIIFIAIVVAIVILVLLNMTVFTINSVSVENEVYSAYIDASGIIQASGLSKGKNIFFISESSSAAGVERAYPYLKVSSIERKFPSKVVIHVDVRQGMMSIASEEYGVYAIVDEDLKVLELVSADAAVYAQATHVEGIKLSNPQPGTVLDGTSVYNACLSSVSSVATGEGLQFAGFFANISFQDANLYVTLRTGVTIRIDNWQSVDVTEHLRYALAKYKSMDEQDYRRRQGFIYFDSALGWNWRSTDVE